jgi:hypothetical protein
MAIMESSNRKSNRKIYCSIRNEPVLALPEEEVRQALISQMVGSLGYPKQNLAIEKALKHMPHLSQENYKFPERRADLVCFAKGIHPIHEIFPLLLIECKAVNLTQKVMQQVVGYNYYLKAYFIAVANSSHIRTGWFDPISKEYRFVERLPKYEELINSISR